MKNVLRKTQQKIYAIFQMLKSYASKLRISSFVGGQFKKRQKRKWLKNWVKHSKKENMKFEQQKPLKLKTEHLNNAKSFCKTFLEYMQSDNDVQQFYEDGAWDYDSFRKVLAVGSGWNTGQRFKLKYLDVVQLTQGLGLKFNFEILTRVYFEEGVQENGEPCLTTKHIFKPTNLNFYIQYVDNNFTVMTDNSHSNHINDYEFIINEIAKKLAE